LVLSFLALGCAGIIPLLLTMVQKGFYMVPAMPFFSIGLSIYIVDDLARLLNKSNIKTFQFISIIAIGIFVTLVSFLFYNYGKYSRDEVKLKDLKIISRTIPEKTIIGCSEALMNDWSLRTYGARYYFYSFDNQIEQTNFVIVSEETDFVKDTSFRKLQLNTAYYHVFKRY
jgi:Co/Zn/Cd efflux system component